MGYYYLSYTLSFTDAKYAKLSRLATTARLSCSEYIIQKLGLSNYSAYQ